MRGLVFALNAEEFFLAGRSERSLRVQGLAVETSVLGRERLANALENREAALLLIQAGSWLERCAGSIPPSQTGLPLVGVGKTRDNPAGAQSSGVDAWRTPRVLYLEPESAKELSRLLRVEPWPEAIQRLLQDTRFRRLRLPELAHGYDPALRILQVVTTLQIGGAERVTLDLAEGLSRRGHGVWVAALGRSTRKSYPAPRGFIDLSSIKSSPQARAQAIAELAREREVDLVHGHLISGGESEALQELGLPLVVTLHNMPWAWPAGWSVLERQPDLTIACSRAVEEAFAAVSLSPCRTAWNGIAAGRYAPTAERRAAGLNWRLAQGWEAGDFVVIAVANPRKQKRLERIPEILAKLQLEMPGRRVRCIIAGDSAAKGVDAQEAQAALQCALAEWGGAVVQVGCSDAVGTLLQAADVFLSVSRFEGLSLAQLEALAAGLPVVSTDVGAAAEIALELGAQAAFYQRLPVDAAAETFAEALRRAPQIERVSRLPKAFEKERMAQRIEQLYRMALASRQRTGKSPRGLWIIANNFSMGGAQSSARRLLVALQAQGVAVRAFTVREAQPTRTSAGLRAQGIEVTPLVSSDVPKAVAEILAEAAGEPPEAVLFWNLIASYKMLLADGLEGIPVFEVSPGEMCFHSLLDYFRMPRAELPYRDPLQYGARLAGVVVKFARERSVAERHLGRPVAVIRNGVELQFRRERGRGPTLVFGTAARISPDKRLEELIAAFLLASPGLPPFELHIAGKIEQGADAYAQQLRAQGAALPIVWRGELFGTADFFEEIDLFVMISEPAGCPNASLEAMAAGLPVIATDVGGAHEQIVDGITGRLIPRADAAALAQALVELAHDPQAQASFGRAAQAWVAQEFSLAAMAANYRAHCALRPRNISAMPSLSGRISDSLQAQLQRRPKDDG